MTMEIDALHSGQPMRNSLDPCNTCAEWQQQAERVRVLREALADAIVCVQDWGLYASPYFIEKHDLNGDIERLRAALEATK